MALILVMGVTILIAYFSNFPAVQNRSVSGGGNTAGREDGKAAARNSVYALTIEISPMRVVWVQAVADGERVLYALIDSDQRRVITAHREVVLRIGDAVSGSDGP